MSFGFIPDPGLFSVAIPPFASDIWKDLFGTIKGKSLTSTEFFDENFIEFLVYFFTRAEIWLHSTSFRRKNSKTRWYGLFWATSKSKNPQKSWFLQFSFKFFSLFFFEFWRFSLRNCELKAPSQRTRRKNSKIRWYERERADLSFAIFHQISTNFHQIFKEKIR